MNEEKEKQETYSSFKEMFDDYIDVCLFYGISEDRFWNMTLGEVKREIKIAKKREEYDLKQKATMDYINTITLVKGISLLFSGGKTKDKMPTLEETYPFLFQDNSKPKVKLTKEELEERMKLYREKLEAVDRRCREELKNKGVDDK